MPTKKKTKKKAPSRAKPKTVAAYLDRLSPDHREALERVRKIVRSLSPKIEEAISYDMIGFRLEGKWIVWIGAGAKHCALYGVRAEGDELDGYDTSGRGTVRFPPAEPLPAALIKKLVKARIAKSAER